MKRRKFIKYSSILISSSSLMTSCHSSQKKSKKTELKAFIISDAHIGWKEKDQPSISEQNRCINLILKKFPDLDLAFDTGDIHHGYLNEKERKKARSLWLENIANQFSRIPFHYIPGNHELGKGENDPEIVAADFGSIPFRPYYSFDQLGIHFISLPQLLSTILITEETINWLKLDLLLNKDKTTIIMSHNSIKGTTYNNGETGYRCLANSESILTILKENPQIVAWFHGHNHQYEIVKLNDVIYVSNGRIGGFNPPESWGDFAQGHLGGIYFEITSSNITINAYSATDDTLLSDIGFKNLSLKFKTKTSFDPNANFNYYCGHGHSTNNITFNLNNHYLSKTKPKLIYQSINKPINENSKLSLPTNYFFADKEVNKIIGYKFNSKKIKFDLVDSNIKVSNPDQLNNFMLSFPTFKNKNSGLYKRGSYYRCAWNEYYQLQVKTSESIQIDSLVLKAKILDFDFNICENIKPLSSSLEDKLFKFTLKTGNGNGLTNHIYLFLDLFFHNFPKEFLIETIELRPVKSKTSKIGNLTHNSKQYEILPQSNPQFISLDSSDQKKDILKFNNLNGQSVCWLVRYTAIQWQIRNGYGYFESNNLMLFMSQSDYHFSKEMVVTPTQKMDFYLNKVIRANKISISYYEPNRCSILLNTLSKSQELVFYSTKRIKSITGAKVIITSLNSFSIRPTNTQIIIDLI